LSENYSHLHTKFKKIVFFWEHVYPGANRGDAISFSMDAGFVPAVMVGVGQPGKARWTDARRGQSTDYRPSMEQSQKGKAAVGLPVLSPSPTPRRAYGRPLHTPKRCFHSSMVLAVGSPSLRAHTVDSAVRMHIERWTNLAAIGRPAASVCPVGGVTRSVGPVRPRRRRIRSSQVSTVETLACEDPSPWSNKQWRESTKSKID
jgi:hypothetical protein